MLQWTTQMTRRCSKARPVFLIALIALTLATIFSTTTRQAFAQYLAWPPGERDEGVVNCVPQQCLAYLSWSSTAPYDTTANPTEAYLGKPEIQASIEKLRKAILKFAKKNAPDSAEGQAILAMQPDLFLKQPAAIFLSALDIENKTGTGGAVMKLGELEANAKDLLEIMIKSDDDVEFATIDVAGVSCYSFLPKEGPEVQLGIVNNYFLLAFGELSIADLLDNMKTAPPTWLQEIDQRIAIQRPAFTCYFDISNLYKLVAQAAEADKTTKETDVEKFREVAKLLRLAEFDSLQYQSGMNSDGFNQVMHVNHSTPNEGLLSFLSSAPLQRGDITSIPEDSSLAGAVKIAPDKIISLAKQIAQLSEENGLENYKKTLADVRERFGLDLEKDVFEALEGTAFLYADPSLTSPKLVGAIRVKDPARFAKSFETINAQLEKKLLEIDAGFQKVQKKDQTFFEVTPMYSSPICYGFVDDTLYFCNSVRGIVSHLRKKDRDYGKLVQTPQFMKFLEQGEADGYQGMIGFSLYDLSAAIETGLPIANMFLQDKLDRSVFDFTLEDLPSVEALVSGLRPTTSVIYRTDTGLAMRGVNDLPLSYDLATTGVLIGMLLPAVQQVRAAARRTIAMNNLRQMALALLNYENARGHFPPAYSVNDDGTPLLSWRVAILPYMEQNALYEQFHLDEPWDSPHNIALSEQMPEVFNHPSYGSLGNQTVFVAPVGNDSILSPGPIDDSGNGNEIAGITDGLSNTPLLVTVNEINAVVWTSPEDLPYDDLGDEQLAGAVSGYLNQMQTVLGDGSTHSFDGLSIESLGGQGLRSGFNKSDEVPLQLAP